MTEKGGDDKVDWVRPVATGVPIHNLDAHKLADASEKHGVKVDLEPSKTTATISQTVVEGMPAPRESDE